MTGWTVALFVAVDVAIVLYVLVGRWPHEVGVDSDPLAGETEGVVGAMAAADANTSEEDAA